MKVWFWCLHCNRCFQAEVPDDAKRDRNGNLYFEDTPKECPYPGCNGHFGDLWEWEKLERMYSQYPEIPEKDKVYPLYPNLGRSRMFPKGG